MGRSVGAPSQREISQMRNGSAGDQDDEEVAPRDGISNFGKKWSCSEMTGYAELLQLERRRRKGSQKRRRTQVRRVQLCRALPHVSL